MVYVDFNLRRKDNDSFWVAYVYDTFSFKL